MIVFPTCCGKIRKFLAVVLCCWHFGQGADLKAISGEFTATITRIEGEAFILNYGNKRQTGPGPHYYYDGKYYSLKKAKVGDSLVAGNIIRTAALGRVRLVYRYGDYLDVGDDSYLRLRTFGTRHKQRLVWRLDLGKVRGFIRQDNGLAGSLLQVQKVYTYLRNNEFYIGVNHGGQAEYMALRGDMRLVTDPQKPTYVLGSGNRVVLQNQQIVFADTITRGQLFRMQSDTRLAYSPLASRTLARQGQVTALESEVFRNLLRGLQINDDEVYRKYLALPDAPQQLDSLLGFSVAALAQRAPLSLKEKILSDHEREQEELLRQQPINPFYQDKDAGD